MDSQYGRVIDIKKLDEVTDHPPTMVQRGKRTGIAVNGFVSQEVLLPILEIP